MGKHGPCNHCGATSTPLWRNGPPEKPVLCNACGSRWRTKGTLMNYTPSRARDSVESEESKPTGKAKMSLKLIEKLGKWNNSNVKEHSIDGDYCPCLSNRSSSGSAVSCTESYAHFNGADICDISGSFQSNAWESAVPSRKRTGITRKPSSVERLSKDLLRRRKPSSVEKLSQDLNYIIHQDSPYVTLSEGDLLYENTTPMGSLEIGCGVMLLKNPKLLDTEEESQGSSLREENKLAVCTTLPVLVHTQGWATGIMCKQLKNTQEIAEQPRRVKHRKERPNILEDKNSILGSIDLMDIACFEGFTRFLTREEQLKLMTFLPTVDISMLPESLKCMFSSPHFVKAILFYQKLLKVGIFDLSCLSMEAEDCKDLKRLSLSSLSNSRLVQRYHELLKGSECGEPSGETRGVSGVDHTFCSTRSRPKRTIESTTGIQNNVFPEAKHVVESPRRSCSHWIRNQPTIRNLQGDLNLLGASEANESRDSLCTPRTPAFPFFQTVTADPLQSSDGSSDQELLLDVRSKTSFPEAELLSEIWIQKTTGKRCWTPCTISEKEGSPSCLSDVTSCINQPNSGSSLEWWVADGCFW